jgi:L-ascorbate metabolism protein UlaG (beta-lactamase superfamily)
MTFIKYLTLILAVIAVLGVIADWSLSSADYRDGASTMSKINRSLQFKDGEFFNEVPWQSPSFLKTMSSMWEFLFGGDQRTPGGMLPRQMADLNYFHQPDTNQLNVTWLGHSSLMINMDGVRILTDPVYETKVSVFGPTRFNGEVPVDISAIGEVDLVLISHNHYDHLNQYTIQQLNDRVARYIVPLGVAAQLIDWGVEQAKITELDWWDGIELENDIRLTATPAQHFSGRGLTDRNETLWVSYVVQSKHYRIYFSGDSGYFDGFRKIGEKYGPFDMTFIECGAYNENWHAIHMYPEETAQAHIDLRGEILHPIHWGTFNLSLHPWFEPMQRLSRAADSLNITTATPIVGETTVYGQYLPGRHWWPEKHATVQTNNITEYQK